MFNIIQNLLTISPYTRSGKRLIEVRAIVIHWVGNPNSSAMANRNYWETLKSGGRYASAHYIIGLQGEIVQAIPENEVAFHIGTTIEKASALAKSSLFNNQQNYYTIGIEHCHVDWDGNFNSATYQTSINFVASLLKKYGLGVDRIFRHYDFSGKDCPKLFVNHPEKFQKYKDDVKNILYGVTPEKKTVKERAVNVAVGIGVSGGLMALFMNIWKKIRG